MESKWFIRILALLLALLLYITVYIEEHGKNLSASSNNYSTTIEDVEVEVYYDEENFVVTGVPETVDVHVEGNISLIQITKSLRDFTVYLDLRNAKIGLQEVELKIKGISDKLKVKIDPAVVTVNVQEKVTREFDVEAEFNKEFLEEGYSIEQPMIEPRKVKITGAKDIINEISYVKAIINVDKPISETFTQVANVTVLDKHMNKLNVVVEPEKVEVTVPIVSPKKTVPVVIKQIGSPKEGIIIKSIEPAIREVILFGKKKTLDEITSIEIPVDVSTIEKNTEVTIPIELKEGITQASPESITVSIIVEKEETKEMTGIPISYNGLDNLYRLDFVEPNNGQASITVTGPTEKIKNLSKKDFKLSIDVTNLKEGIHKVNITVEAPEEVKWKLNQKQVTISISKIEG